MKFSFVLALALVFNVAFTANAQQAKGVEVTPCPNETASRPTLKRRQTNPDTQPAAGEKDVAVLSAAPCDNAVLESKKVTVQDPLTIQFEGLGAAEESEIRKYFRERGILRSLDSARDSSIVDAETAIKNLLGDYGHRHAEVSSRFDLSGKGSPVLTFVISEGPRFTISEIRFIGNRVFSEELLAAKIKECRLPLTRMGEMSIAPKSSNTAFTC